MFKHTNGSWRIVTNIVPDTKNLAEQLAITSLVNPSDKPDGTHRCIARLLPYGSGETGAEFSEETFANAKLIRAAPQLLDALIGCLLWFDSHMQEKALDAIRAALGTNWPQTNRELSAGYKWPHERVEK